VRSAVRSGGSTDSCGQRPRQSADQHVCAWASWEKFLAVIGGHLRWILREYETHHDQHRAHRSLDAAAPQKPLPEPIDLDQYRVTRQARVGGLINEYHRVA
jgi:hypothetical protein